MIFSLIFFIPILITRFILIKSEFPSILKLANITPVFKKVDRNSKENYRPVSILSNISKSLNDACFVKFSVLWIPIKATMWVYKSLQTTVLPVDDARKM